MIKCITTYTADANYVSSWSFTNHEGRFISVIVGSSYIISGYWSVDTNNLNYLECLKRCARVKNKSSKELISLIESAIAGFIL
jgi:hypothetical protein